MYKRSRDIIQKILITFLSTRKTQSIWLKRNICGIYSASKTQAWQISLYHSLKKRNLKDKEGERTVEVSEEVLNQLHSAHYFSKKKGKALFMISASKGLGTIKRKQKKQIKEFDQLKEILKKKNINQKDQNIVMIKIKRYRVVTIKIYENNN